MKAIFMLFLWVLAPVFLFAQDPIGLPQVSSYTSTVYKAGTQNWGIAQDKNGVLYFANNEGMLSFNGAYWKLHITPNKTNVRSVKIDKTGRIYIGGQDEIGFFAPNENGVLTYQSLKHLVPEGERQFADIWDIKINNGEVFFRTVNKIFRLKNNKIDVYVTREAWVFIGQVNNQIIAHENKVGLKAFKDNQWISFCNDKRILNSTVTSVLPYNGDTLLVTTLKNGMFLLVGEKLLEKKTPNDNTFINDRINGAIQINKDLYAIGTTSAALLIINKKGVIKRQFSYTEGLNNANIRSVLVDQHQNLWVALDDGIAFIAFNSAIKHIYPDKNKQVSSYASRIFDNKLYIGTSNGVLAADVNVNQGDISNSQANFKEVANTKGQTWGLAEVNNHLLLANEDGGSVIKGYGAKQLYDGLGTWLYQPLSADKIVAGTYTGLQLLGSDNEDFKVKGTLSALNEPLRFVVVDEKLNCVWASHPYRGVYKLDLDANKQKIIKTT
ncbi:MAG: transcriptional regulator, partial [Pedobacter sp.]